MRCPHCAAVIGRPAAEGGLRLNGLAILLVKADGRIHGPCRECHGDVVISDSAPLTKSVSAAVDPPKPKRSAGKRRLVLVLDPEGG